MALLNSNNFCSWSASIETCYYSLPLVEGDEINIFGNFILDDNVYTAAFLKIGLWSPNLGFYLEDIANITTILVDTKLYSWYADTWTVPALPKNENFRFVLYNTSPTVWFYSNSFRVVNNTDYTSVVRFRNSNDALGYLYESVPSFYNEFRIDLWTGRPGYNENVKGYDTYEGGFISVKSDVQKIRNFQTRYFDEVANEAFFSMLTQSEFYIDDIRYKKLQDSSYEIAWSEDDSTKIGNGAVGLLIDDYSSAVINCN